MAAVGKLAAGMAHEINTPLGGVRLQVESALRRLDSRPELTAERLAKALAGIDQIALLLEKLLFYSREGRQSQLVDLCSVVEDTLLLEGRQHWTGHELTKELKAVPTFVGVPSDLQQLLTILFERARAAATQVSHGKVWVATGMAAAGFWLRVNPAAPQLAGDLDLQTARELAHRNDAVLQIDEKGYLLFRQ